MQQSMFSLSPFPTNLDLRGVSQRSEIDDTAELTGQTSFELQYCPDRHRLPARLSLFLSLIFELLLPDGPDLFISQGKPPVSSYPPKT